MIPVKITKEEMKKLLEGMFASGQIEMLRDIANSNPQLRSKLIPKIEKLEKQFTPLFEECILIEEKTGINPSFRKWK